MQPGLVTAMEGKPPDVLHPGGVTDISSFLEASLTLLRKGLLPQHPSPKPILPCLLTHLINGIVRQTIPFSMSLP